MLASRGMGAIAESKMPKGKKKARRDNTDFTEYAEGGKVKKWIQGAIEHKGALREQLGVPEGKNIPAKKLAKAAKAPGVLGKRARLTQTLKGMK